MRCGEDNFYEELNEPFTKTLSSRVLNGHSDSIGVRWIPNMLYG